MPERRETLDQYEITEAKLPPQRPPIENSTDRKAMHSQDVLLLLKSKRLIVPSISVGNVPQLAVDLLLHNHNFELITALDSTLLYPFASPVDYTTNQPRVGEVSTGFELYVDETNGLALVQQRTPILPGYGKNFIDYLTSFIISAQFSQVLLLDSNNCTLRSNLDVHSPIEVFSNDLSEQFKQFTIGEQEDSEVGVTPYVNALIKSLQDHVTVFALVMFVYEGDNLFDSQVFASRVLKLLKIKEPEWRKPKSWESLYGDRPLPLGLEAGIYG